MHLIESYSFNTGGSKISHPFIYEKYFPVPYEKYITFQGFTKQAKTYDLYPKVFSIIGKELDKRNIKILQLGNKGEPEIQSCAVLNGQTSINNAAYLIRRGLCHVGADSICAHIAGSFDKKNVVLISNNYPDCIKPYWGKNNIIITPDNHKPSFSFEENPKTINTIKPEIVAEKILQAIDIVPDSPYGYETVHVGNYFFNAILEIIPDTVANPRQFNPQAVVIRMDQVFNEQALAQQLQFSNAIIVTNKPINIEMLKHFKAHIQIVNYVIGNEHSVAFVSEMRKNKIPYSLMSYLDDALIKKIKIHFIDYGIIKQVNESQIRGKFAGCFFETNRKIIAKNGIFKSIAHWKKNIVTNSEMSPVIDDDLFWRDIDHFCISKKV